MKLRRDCVKVRVLQNHLIHHQNREECRMNKRRVGSVYEEKAAEYLEKNGYRILKRNFRCRRGEIDLIASGKEGADSVLVFIEVKYRLSDSIGRPEEAVTPLKMKNICRTTDYYRICNGIPEDRTCRFDVIAIQGDNLRHYKNAFPYVQ